MLTQIDSLRENLYEGTQGWKQYLRQLVYRNSEKISAFLLVSKMLTVFAFLALVPFGTASIGERQTYQTSVKLDTTTPFVLTTKDRQLALETGTANADVKVAPKSNSVRIASAGSLPSVSRDPSYFRGLYERAGATYNVPWQLIQAVHYIETGASDSTAKSSYAGATGPMQFMPGTWRAYAVDGNGDGTAEITNVDDAVFGAANLLAAGGAAEGDYQSALFNYNHSQSYVNKVMGVALDAGM